MIRKKFIEALRAGGLVFDGAMGTALYERGLLYTSCLDHAVVTRSDVVRHIHDAYVRAGADVIETNTFGANRYRLTPHGLENDVAAINEKGVALARASAGEHVYVAGSMGPSGLMMKTVRDVEHPNMRAAFREQAAALCGAGVDVIVLETFRQPDELVLAIEGARSGSRNAVPIAALCSFDTFGTMADGKGPEEMARLLEGLGVDAVGVNCADGPAGVFEMATRMLGTGAPVIAQPNAGLPRRVEGRFAYMATPEYFQLYARRLFKAGVHAVGGCCGTTADHVKKIAAASRMVAGSLAMSPEDSSPGISIGGGGMREDSVPPPPMSAPGIVVASTSQKGAIGAKLGKQFLVSVEVNPPPGLSLESAIEGARLLTEGGVDIINVADGPRASARMGNLALCHRIQEKLGVPSLMHVTTRDRNILGLVAHLLAAHDFGVKNLVIITGDPPKMGDFPDATPVYDTDSIGLLRIVRGLNHGIDPGGKPMEAATSFLCATGAEPAAKDYERELTRLRAKVDGGAELVMTQPVYDTAVLERFLKDVAPLKVPVLVGLLPLASYRNAEFLHNEVPGMSIPEDVRERMRKAGSGDKGRAEGVAIAREMLGAVKDRVAGAYVMPPFNRYELALRVIEGIVR